jgi:phospholipase C
MAQHMMIRSLRRWLSIAGILAGLNACGGGPSSSQAANPDFQISATALSPAAVTAGSSGSSTITIAALGGFSGAVALACSGLPNGASCLFDPASVTGSGTSQLTVSISTAAMPGSYSFNVQGSSGSMNHNLALTLAVQSQIQHVVIIFQENRSPDNLFQDQNLINAGADIASSGKNSKGQIISLAKGTLQTNYDLGHTHMSFTEMYDDGAMDGADKISVSCAAGATDCPPPNPQYIYVDPATVAPYFELAETYTFGDRMFQTNQGPSFPAHQFIISGTSAPAPPGDVTSDLFAAENMSPATANNATGCTAAADVSVFLIDPSGNETQSMYPCFDHPTLTDLLDANGISWRYYAPGPGSIWTGPNAIKHMCVPNSTATQCTGTDWTSSVILQSKQILTDVANGQLAGVTWVIPDGAYSDHARMNDGSGPSWVASVVNAIGNSTFWPSTAIIVTWDDWGGWYDHVPPPSIYNSYEYGFRVPLIVVSPYAKAHYISHVTHDFGSILKFTETMFHLPVVDSSYADARADDLSDCFDFNQTPLSFKTINSALKAKFFIEDNRPPSPPDDD